MPTDLTTQLASRIADQIKAGDSPPGTRLIERVLADTMRVSRSPIRSALRLLASEGVVSSAEGGGFVVEGSPAVLQDKLAPSADEAAYLEIAQDRLDGAIPTRMTETALARRYGLTKAQLARILRRIAGEGWIERLPGHGWAFLPVLTSMQAYRDSYSFRLVIEPAAILEASFALNAPALRRCRDLQQRLVDGDIWTVSNAALFDLNSTLHQTVIACSANSFFIESLKRVDGLRRLMEYRQSLDRKYAITRCHEHLHLVDLLLADRRTDASMFMRQHLSSVSIEKTMPRDVE